MKIRKFNSFSFFCVFFWQIVVYQTSARYTLFCSAFGVILYGPDSLGFDHLHTRKLIQWVECFWPFINLKLPASFDQVHSKYCKWAYKCILITYCKLIFISGLMFFFKKNKNLCICSKRSNRTCFFCYMFCIRKNPNSYGSRLIRKRIIENVWPLHDEYKTVTWPLYGGYKSIVKLELYFCDLLWYLVLIFLILKNCVLVYIVHRSFSTCWVFFETLYSYYIFLDKNEDQLDEEERTLNWGWWRRCFPV